MQNLTSYSCSATLISYKCDEISRLSRLVIEIPIMGYLGVFGFWGYLATSDEKSDVIFLLFDPDFLNGWWNFASISRSYTDPHFGLFGGFRSLEVFSYLRCKSWRHILAWRPFFPIKATKLNAYLVSFSRFPFWGIWRVGAPLGYLTSYSCSATPIKITKFYAYFA